MQTYIIHEHDSTRVPTLLPIKNSGTFQDHENFFHDLLEACQQFLNKQQLHTAQSTECNPIHIVLQEQKLSGNCFSYIYLHDIHYRRQWRKQFTSLSVLAACCQAFDRELKTLINYGKNFPGSQTLIHHFNLQDFTGPNSFSRTFKILEIKREKFQTFPGLSRRQKNPEYRQFLYIILKWLSVFFTYFF